jgi:hypothetical protein
MIVHQAGSDGKWSWATTLNLGEDLSRALSTIRLADFIAMETGAKQNSMLAIIWAEMKSAFNGGKKADSILLAAQWFFNGSHGPDELLKYVQAMVVLEILLGDKRASDQMGLNELLRNRCAYLIGNSHEDRRRFMSYSAKSMMCDRKLSIGESTV